jgi:phage shock protein C
MEQKMKILDQHNLFTRSDTIFGVCEGLGEDLRIPANLLRLSLAFLLFLNPPAAVATYIGAG